VLPAKDKPIAVCFVWGSLGELHCLMPILRLLKDEQPNVQIVVAFRLRETLDRFGEDRLYAAMLKDMGAHVVSIRGLLPYVVLKRKQIRLIFKDFTSTRADSLPVVLKQACPNASLILFPHAYALHTSGQEAPALESIISSENFAHEHIDLLVLSSQLDVATWSKRMPTHKIRVLGATGYTEWWGNIMRRYAHEYLNDILEKARGGERRIACT
jgi:hypothetical protein